MPKSRQTQTIVIHRIQEKNDNTNENERQPDPSPYPLLDAFQTSMASSAVDKTWEFIVEEGGGEICYSFRPNSDYIFDHLSVAGDDYGVQYGIIICEPGSRQRQLVKTLSRELGFQRENILTFDVNTVPIGQVHAVLTDMAAKATPGDVIFIYYGNEKDETPDEIFTLVDGGLTVDDFVADFLDPVPAAAKVACLLDSKLVEDAFKFRAAQTKTIHKQDLRSSLGRRDTRIDVITCSPYQNDDEEDAAMIPSRTGLGMAFLKSLSPPSFPQRMDYELLLTQIHIELRNKFSPAGGDLVVPQWTSSHRQDRRELFTMASVEKALLIGVLDDDHDPRDDLYQMRKYWETCNPETPSENCRVLLDTPDDAVNAKYDGPSTMDSILQEIDSFAAGGQPGDHIFLYFSGPGMTRNGRPVLKPSDHHEMGVIEVDVIIDMIASATLDSVRATCLIDSLPDSATPHLPYVTEGDDDQACMFSPANVVSLSGDSRIIEAFQYNASSESTWGGLMDEILDYYSTNDIGHSIRPVLSSTRPINRDTYMHFMSGGNAGDRHAILIGVDSGNGKTAATLRKFQKYLEIRQGFLRGTQNVVLVDDAKGTIPTRSNIVSTLQDLVERTQPGDSIFLAYFGPGDSALEWDYDEDYMRESNPGVIVPVDTDDQQHHERALFNNDIARMLIRQLPEGATVTCLFAYHEYDGRTLRLPHTYYLPPPPPIDGTNRDSMTTNGLMGFVGSLHRRIEDSLASLATEIDVSNPKPHEIPKQGGGGEEEQSDPAHHHRKGRRSTMHVIPGATTGFKEGMGVQAVSANRRSSTAY